MSKDKIYIFDTTLRDGAQTEGVDFSFRCDHTEANLHRMHGISSQVRSFMMPKSMMSAIGIMASPEYQ